MKIGIGSGAYWNENDLKAGFAVMKAQGYDCTDYQPFTDTDNSELFSMSEAEFEKEVLRHKAAFDEAGIEISQTHGPWRWPPRDGTIEGREERFEKMSRALHGTKLLGCKYMVLHPMMPFGNGDDGDRDEFFRINREYYGRLLKVAEQEDVVICLENMPFPKLPLATPAQILGFVKSFDSPYFRVCLDTGHAAVCGVGCGEAVRQLGKEYLKVLHVHDNNGKADQHLYPYHGVIDWADFGKALHETGYEGVLSLECHAGKNLPEALKEYYQKGLLMIAQAIIGK